MYDVTATGSTHRAPKPGNPWKSRKSSRKLLTIVLIDSLCCTCMEDIIIYNINQPYAYKGPREGYIIYPLLVD